MGTTLRLLPLLGILALSGSTHPPSKTSSGFSFVDQRTLFDAETGGRLIWSRGDLGIRSDGETANGRSGAGHLALADFSDPLFAVTFPAGSDLSERMAWHPGTKMYWPGSLEQPGAALFAPADSSDLAEIAAAGHEALPGVCGQVEWVQGFALLDLESYRGPRYSEAVNLDEVADLSNALDSDKIQTQVEKLVALGTRFHGSEKPNEASELIESLFKEAGEGVSGLTVAPYVHENMALTEQNSVIAKIPGTDSSLGTIIIGAHLDSINRADNTDAPGADDNASGIAVLIEMLRAIKASGATFDKTIEFHAYAAEEVGLLGSKDIAEAYKTSGRKVDAMLQLDMISWSSDSTSRTIYLVENRTSPILRRSLKDLLNSYLGGDYETKALSAGTSDHTAWTDRGFHAVFPFEDPDDFNSSLHTKEDTVKNINNFTLAERFAKLALIFLGHHAGLVSAKASYDAAIAGTTALPNDLKLAFLGKKGASLWGIAVATPADVKGVEVCKGDAATSTCTGTHVTLGFARASKGRNFFITADGDQATLAAGDYWIFKGYDKNDALVQLRAGTLAEKG